MKLNKNEEIEIIDIVNIMIEISDRISKGYDPDMTYSELEVKLNSQRVKLEKIVDSKLYI